MNIFCPSPQNLCSDPSLPQTNYSSEAPDNRAFFGRAYNPGLFPPLGSSWQSTGCIGTCTSTISQADANACAARQVITCLSGEWPVYEDNPNDDPEQPPVIPRNRATFLNEEQSADFTCPDGNVFTYTIPAGTVEAFSLAAANASALSMAQNGATENRICIGEMSPASLCTAEPFETTVGISAPRLSQPGYELVVTITSGVLPPGLQLDYGADSFTISGEASNGGQYDFTVRADVLEGGFLGSFMEKAFTLYVLEIVQDSLANGTVGNVYSQQLTTAGPTFGSVVWAVASGALPSGLSLNSSTGAITGTPTTEQTSTFTISATDDQTSCSKEYTIDVGPGVGYQDLVWSLQTLQQTGTGIATWISPGAGNQSNTWEAETSATVAGGTNIGRLIIRATLVYAGPNRAGRAIITVSNNNEQNAPPGINNCSLDYFVNGFFQVGAGMPAAPIPFNGQYTLDFTATAGTMEFVFDIITSQPGGAQPSPMTIHASGEFLNL